MVLCGSLLHNRPSFLSLVTLMHIALSFCTLTRFLLAARFFSCSVVNVFFGYKNIQNGKLLSLELWFFTGDACVSCNNMLFAEKIIPIAFACILNRGFLLARLHP